MQFGGTPMQVSPASTGLISSSSSLPLSAPVSLEESPRAILSNSDNNSDADSTASSMFAPHPSLNTHTNGMFQNHGNGHASNEQVPSGNHYVSNNQQQQQQQPQPQSPAQQQRLMNQANPSSGSTANGGGSNTSTLIYPALHLQPLNDTFAPKQISLSPPGPQNKVKIGRQTNNKTTPQPSNGYFDSKVLSRAHAEVWSQDGKVYIKDVKSSNGTFINGSRLSLEGQESDIFELHTDDIVEFGIDIVGEDNKTIIHHKVACRAFLVMTAEEALGLRHDFAALYRGGIAGSTLNHHSVGPGAEGGLRRSKLGSTSGGSGYGNAANGNNIMSFDHILHKLQAELQKSRDTASELGHLNTAMSDIGETLGGGLPPMQNPPYQHMVPSLNGEREAQNGGLEQEGGPLSSEMLIKALEEQVRETQRALNMQVDRLTGVEARLEEQDGVKMDVSEMRSQVEEARRELHEAMRLRSLAGRGFATNGGEGGSRSGDADFDDSESVASIDTVMQESEGAVLGNAPLGVDEVESAEVARQLIHYDEDASLDDAEALQKLKHHVGPLAPPDGVPSSPTEREILANQKNEDIVRRLEAIEGQLERALEIGKNLAGQHAEATETVKRLEEKVKTLESERESSTSKLDKKPLSPVKSEGHPDDIGGRIGDDLVASGSILAILEEKWGQWRDAFEGDFEVEKAGLRGEREEIKRIVKMWDSLNSEIEDTLESDAASTLSREEDASSPIPHDTAASSVPSATTTLSSNPTASAASRKRRKKRAAAAAAAAAAAVSSSASGRSPSISSVGLAGNSSRATSDSTARINRELRSLLYTDNYNFLVREEHLRSDDVGQRSAVYSDREESPPHSRSSRGDTEGGNAILDNRRRERTSLTPAINKKRPGGVLGHGADGALPVLTVFGAVAFGMTAWVLSGGKGFHIGAAP
ncbi:hypothetical protein CBS101457_002818 [Exobasidium rhododendri]|nr:hypothetical protein CBS101457_002818 [Exobasidium rhododendri]